MNCLTLTTSVSTTLILSTYALSQTDQTFQVQPIQLTTSNQNFTGNLIPGFTEYTSFNKGFSLQYPTDWTLEPKTNKFEIADLKMTSPEGVTNGVVLVGYSVLDQKLTSTFKDNHINQKDIKKYLDLTVRRFQSGFVKGLDNFKRFKEPDYA